MLFYKTREIGVLGILVGFGNKSYLHEQLIQDGARQLIYVGEGGVCHTLHIAFISTFIWEDNTFLKRRVH